MKVKTSITIADHLLKEIDDIIHDSRNRSRFIEEAIIFYIDKKRKKVRDNKDLELINNAEKSLNDEALEVLSYQVKL